MALETAYTVDSCACLLPDAAAGEPAADAGSGELAERFRPAAAGVLLTASPLLRFKLPRFMPVEEAYTRYFSDPRLKDAEVGRLRENELTVNKEMETLHKRQHMVVLFQQRPLNAAKLKGQPSKPVPKMIEFYSENDSTLGAYLRTSCFLARGSPPDPRRDIYRRLRTYTHNSGRISIKVHRQQEVSEANDIYMWSWCKICKKPTPRQKMSKGTSDYSFGKFLEACFYNTSACALSEACQHSLHRQHTRFFALRSEVVQFDYAEVSVLECALPATQLYAPTDRLVQLQQEETQAVTETAHLFFTNAKILLQEVIQQEPNESVRGKLGELAQSMDAERDSAMARLQNLPARYHNAGGLRLLPHTTELNKLKWQLRKNQESWNTYLQQAFGIESKTQRRNVRAALSFEDDNILAEPNLEVAGGVGSPQGTDHAAVMMVHARGGQWAQLEQLAARYKMEFLERQNQFRAGEASMPPQPVDWNELIAGQQLNLLHLVVLAGKRDLLLR
jgi:hypothetical protein